LGVHPQREETSLDFHFNTAVHFDFPRHLNLLNLSDHWDEIGHKSTCNTLEQGALVLQMRAVGSAQIVLQIQYKPNFRVLKKIHEFNLSCALEAPEGLATIRQK
jgi:hypothetical protein